MNDPILRALLALSIILLIIFAFIAKVAIDEHYKPKLSEEEIEEMRAEKFGERSSSLVTEQQSSHLVQPHATMPPEVA